MKLLITAFAILFCVYVIYEYLRIKPLIAHTQSLIVTAHPYERSTGTRSLFVVGDSTGVGVGSLHSVESVAGRLSQLLDTSVENHAVSGARVFEVPAQLKKATQKKYDVVLIQIGANDVTHFTSLDDLQTNLDAILVSAKEKSDHVILMTSGKVGDAPFIPRSIAPLFNYRSRQVRDLFIRVSEAHVVAYVDLLAVSAVFDTDHDKYYAADYFHPSSDGYALWYGVLKDTITKSWPELVHES